MSTDRRFVRDLNSLVKERAGGDLKPLKPRGGLPSRVGIGLPSAGSGGGISSPLTEDDATTRTYHGVQSIVSSDGLFVLEIEPLAHLEMTDAAGNPVVFEFADPPDETPGP